MGYDTQRLIMEAAGILDGTRDSLGRSSKFDVEQAVVRACSRLGYRVGVDIPLSARAGIVDLIYSSLEREGMTR